MDQQEGAFKLCGKRCILYTIRVYLFAGPVMEICNEADRYYVLIKTVTGLKKQSVLMGGLLFVCIK